MGVWSPLMSIIAGEAPPQHLGLTFGLTNTLAQLGAMSAPLIGGWLRDRTASFAAACYLSAAVLGLAAVVVLVAFRGEKPFWGPGEYRTNCLRTVQIALGLGKATGVRGVEGPRLRALEFPAKLAWELPASQFLVQGSVAILEEPRPGGPYGR